MSTAGWGAFARVAIAVISFFDTTVSSERCVATSVWMRNRPAFISRFLLVIAAPISINT
jgi:hypothetical protein